jgi:hypothetical protein
MQLPFPAPPRRGFHAFPPAAALCLALFLFSPGLCRAAFTDNPVQEDETGETRLSPELEKTLTGLLDAVDPGRAPPPEAELADLVNFMIFSAMPEKVLPAERAEGEGVFSRRHLRLPFQKLLRYCFDPDIPTEVIYPTVLRRGRWLPQSRAALKDARLWERLRERETVTLRGLEYEEITPDSFSGCYYHYTLHRLIILTHIGDRAAVIAVSRQTGPSSVGYKGAVVGRDSDWNYVYTKVVGSTLKLVGWAETYMYGSANVTVLFENGEESGLAFFKWVKAGWSNLNMVKSGHILAGGRRFLDGMCQVLEAPSLPTPEEIREHHNALTAMDDARLRAALAPYAALLEDKAAESALLSNKDFRAVFKDGGYPERLEREDLISELMKLYMKERLGMRASASRS